MLRARGMRSTPQRRAILCGVPLVARTEHLSADEVYARACPYLFSELSRGTVYATLAEFCRDPASCSRPTAQPNRSAESQGRPARALPLSDLPPHLRHRAASRDPTAVGPPFRVERIDLRVDGICGDCTDYESGLRAGARAVGRATSTETPRDGKTPIASSEYASPPGPPAGRRDSRRDRAGSRPRARRRPLPARDRDALPPHVRGPRPSRRCTHPTRPVLFRRHRAPAMRDRLVAPEPRHRRRPTGPLSAYPRVSTAPTTSLTSCSPGQPAGADLRS